MYTSAGEAYNAFKLGNLDLMTTQSLNYEEHIGTMGYKTVEYIGREYEEGFAETIPLYILDLQKQFTSHTEALIKLDEKQILTAKELLEEAGWELISGNWQKQEEGTTIRARVNLVVDASNAKRIVVAEEIEKQLAETGIIVNTIRASSTQYAKYLENKNYDMILTGKLIGISPDLTSYIGNGNLSQFEDTEANALLREIADLSDNETELQNKYKQLVRLIEEKRPYVSLYFNRGTVIYTQDLQGKISPNFYNVFYNIEEWVRQY